MSCDLPKVCLVVPCYNEESILAGTMAELSAAVDRLAQQALLAPQSFILMVDDGSRDHTWDVIAELHRRNPERFHGLKLAANRGHQNALLAGLLHAELQCDASISIDADLQDDLNALEPFLREFGKGRDIVFGVRSDRSSDSFVKRFFAESFYRVLRFLGVNVIFNHADYRLMSRRAMAALAQYGEVNLYLRGIVCSMGLPSAIVTYRRKKTDRPTHYSLRKMLNLAWDGISSFSIRPIRLITLFGVFSMLVSFVLLCWVLFCYFAGKTVPGWSSLLAVILFCNGVQSLAIGCIGEYVGKTYLETKARPRFLIETSLE